MWIPALSRYYVSVLGLIADLHLCRACNTIQNINMSRTIARGAVSDFVPQFVHSQAFPKSAAVVHVRCNTDRECPPRVVNNAVYRMCSFHILISINNDSSFDVEDSPHMLAVFTSSHEG
jgi:hypothetical protein